MNSVAREPIAIARRLVGLGVLSIGLFALYNGMPYVQTLWDTPSRNLGIGVIVGAVLMIFAGVVIAVPELLPKSVLALSFIFGGLCTMLMGVSMVLWFLYNMLIERLAEFRSGSPVIALAMIWMGYTWMFKGFARLRQQANDLPTETTP